MAIPKPNMHLNSHHQFYRRIGWEVSTLCLKSQHPILSLFSTMNQVLRVEIPMEIKKCRFLLIFVYQLFGVTFTIPSTTFPSSCIRYKLSKSSNPLLKKITTQVWKIKFIIRVMNTRLYKQTQSVVCSYIINIQGTTAPTYDPEKIGSRQP